MSEIEEFESSLNSNLLRLEKEINNLDKKEYSQKQNAIKKCQELVKSISTLIQSFELEINNLDREEAKHYGKNLKTMESKFNNLKRELEYKKNDGALQGDLFKERTQNNVNPNEMSCKKFDYFFILFLFIIDKDFFI